MWLPKFWMLILLIVVKKLFNLIPHMDDYNFFKIFRVHISAPPPYVWVNHFKNNWALLGKVINTNTPNFRIIRWYTQEWSLGHTHRRINKCQRVELQLKLVLLIHLLHSLFIKLILSQDSFKVNYRDPVYCELGNSDQLLYCLQFHSY